MILVQIAYIVATVITSIMTSTFKSMAQKKNSSNPRTVAMECLQSTK